MKNNKYFLFNIICLPANTNTILKILYETNVTGATIINSHGMYKSKILNFLGFQNYEKELIMFITDEEKGRLALESIKEKINFLKKNSAIFFKVEVDEFHGVYIKENNGSLNYYKESLNMDKKMIVTIVDRNLGDTVIDAANEAGAKGATIIHGRGGGSLAATKLFNLEIEPEKDLVLIICENNIKNDIINSIKHKMDIELPNKGIIFVLDVPETFGIAE